MCLLIPCTDLILIHLEIFQFWNKRLEISFNILTLADTYSTWPFSLSSSSLSPYFSNPRCCHTPAFRPDGANTVAHTASDEKPFSARLEQIERMHDMHLLKSIRGCNELKRTGLQKCWKQSVRLHIFVKVASLKCHCTNYLQ